MQSHCERLGPLLPNLRSADADLARVPCSVFVRSPCVHENQTDICLSPATPRPQKAPFQFPSLPGQEGIKDQGDSPVAWRCPATLPAMHPDEPVPSPLVHQNTVESALQSLAHWARGVRCAKELCRSTSAPAARGSPAQRAIGGPQRERSLCTAKWRRMASKVRPLSLSCA